MIKQGKAWRKKPTVLTLVFALVVYIMEISEHFQGRNVRARVVDDTLAAVLDEILEQLQSLGCDHERSRMKIAR